MSSILLNWSGKDLVIPQNPPADLAVGPDYERFSGVEGSPTLDHPATSDPMDGPDAGSSYGWNQAGHSPRPGQSDQPLGQVYTPGPLQGLVGVVGGQPLPVGQRITRPVGGYTAVVAPSIQKRLGVGQNTSAGAQQTVALQEITDNPPVPGDLTSIIAGLG